MASFFMLELDTTPPAVSITVPNYTIPHVDTEIMVVANEPLDNFQEIYIVDSAGVRHDAIFEFQGDSFRGVVDFCDCALGIATIYARVRDEVHNLSEVAMATIDVKQAAKVFISITEKSREIAAREKTMPLTISENQRDIAITETTREVMLSEITRKIEVAVE